MKFYSLFSRHVSVFFFSIFFSLYFFFFFLKQVDCAQKNITSFFRLQTEVKNRYRRNDSIGIKSGWSPLASELSVFSFLLYPSEIYWGLVFVFEHWICSDKMSFVRLFNRESEKQAKGDFKETFDVIPYSQVNSFAWRIFVKKTKRKLENIPEMQLKKKCHCSPWM